MDSKVQQTIQKYNMLSAGDGVLVGLSGGADSVTLLHILCGMKDTMQLRLYACHVNHGLRGKEADSDEAFCRRLCKELEIELFVLRCNVAEEAKKRKIGTEQCGREIRYAFFAEKAKALQAKIATAHTASDNAETILFNLTRGSGLSGICGIPPVRDNIVRPLIAADRSEIEDYCRRHELRYVTDSSNLTRDYSRNRLRLDVMPVLRQINPRVEASLYDFSERMRLTEEFLNDAAAEALKKASVRGGYDAKTMAELPEAVFAAAARKLCREFALIPEAKHIELMQKIVYNGGAAEIGRGVKAVMKQGIFRICRPKQHRSEDVYIADFSKLLCIDDKILRFRLLKIDEYHNGVKKGDFLLANSLDYGTIPLTSCFRYRKSGDSFSMYPRGLTKPVRKLFNEMKVPTEQRDSILLLADENRILWIEGTGVCRECRVTEKTKKVLVITIETAQEDKKERML